MILISSDTEAHFLNHQICIFGDPSNTNPFLFSPSSSFSTFSCPFSIISLSFPLLFSPPLSFLPVSSPHIPFCIYPLLPFLFLFDPLPLPFSLLSSLTSPPQKFKVWDIWLSCRFCSDSAMLMISVVRVSSLLWI